MLPYLLTAPNSSLSLSVHSNESAYLAKLQASMNVINGWMSKFGIRAIMSDNRAGWVRHYKGLGKFMRPYADGDATASWERCPRTRMSRATGGAAVEMSPDGSLASRRREILAAVAGGLGAVSCLTRA